MKPYEFLEHPAELRLRVFGKTKEELFKNAALALADTLKRRLTRSGRRSTQTKERLKIKSIDLNSLLVDFLNEILARSQINKSVYLVSDVKINSSGFRIQALCIGYPVDYFDEDIKAVTHQDVDIKFKNKLWQTDLVFDV